jgi:hypothetical protein
MRLTLNKINCELAKRGHDERLVRGKGYFYFVGGNAASWQSSGVYTYHLNGFTLEQWLATRDYLASL